MKKKLPVPRMQLRWTPSTIKREYQWECHYELVILLNEHDIRRDAYDKNGNLKKRKLSRELVIAMKGPSLRGSSQIPCSGIDGSRYADDPFRDGAHARWDGAQLGGLPIFVIAPDGEAFKVDYDPKEMLAASDFKEARP